MELSIIKLRPGSGYGYGECFCKFSVDISADFVIYEYLWSLFVWLNKIFLKLYTQRGIEMDPINTRLYEQ